ncbi:unnamed protein product [Dicrocoelium dendriticum]|nr:unnamed protein product [Dicrocoelium dendriticum]
MKAYNNETVKFFILLSATLECFDAHIKNKSVSILDSLSFPAIDQLVVDRSACNICSEAYQNMLEFYNKKIVRLNVDQGEFRIVEYKKFTNDRFAVCFDIQYALNRTEWVWSDLLNCQYSDKFTPHILLPVIVCLITFVTFHTLMCTVFLRPMRVWVYQPKRVALRRSHASTSRPQGQITYVTSYGSLASSSLQQFESTDSLLRHTHQNKHCDEHSHLLSR